MKSHVKHHFVPQFYIRNFSGDDKTIRLYHYKKENKNWIKISSCCQIKNFYGEDHSLEINISSLELDFSKVIRSIIENESLNHLDNDGIDMLLLFISFQYSRTLVSRQMSEQFGNFFLEATLKPMLKMEESIIKNYSEEYIDQCRITSPNLWQMSLNTALSNYHGCADLKRILLINKTPIPFCFGESPVTYNNYMNYSKHSVTGLQSIGLQIFLPICSTLCVLLIDQHAYKFIHDQSNIVEINNIDDISAINALQFFNSENCLYYEKSEFDQYIESIAKNFEKQKEEKILNIDKISSKAKFNPDKKEYWCVSFNGTNQRVKIPFIKLNHAISLRLKNIKKKNKKGGRITPIRSEKTLQFSEKFAELMHNLAKEKSIEQ